MAQQSDNSLLLFQLAGVLAAADTTVAVAVAELDATALALDGTVGIRATSSSSSSSSSLDMDAVTTLCDVLFTTPSDVFSCERHSAILQAFMACVGAEAALTLVPPVAPLKSKAVAVQVDVLAQAFGFVVDLLDLQRWSDGVLRCMLAIVVSTGPVFAPVCTAMAHAVADPDPLPELELLIEDVNEEVSMWVDVCWRLQHLTHESRSHQSTEMRALLHRLDNATVSLLSAIKLAHLATRDHEGPRSRLAGHDHATPDDTVDADLETWRQRGSAPSSAPSREFATAPTTPPFAAHVWLALAHVLKEGGGLHRHMHPEDDDQEADVGLHSRALAVWGAAKTVHIAMATATVDVHNTGGQRAGFAPVAHSSDDDDDSDGDATKELCPAPHVTVRPVPRSDTAFDHAWASLPTATSCLSLSSTASTAAAAALASSEMRPKPAAVVMSQRRTCVQCGRKEDRIGAFRHCSVCNNMQVAYCSAPCQRAHHPTHSADCGR
jgi:hypothetical protein